MTQDAVQILARGIHHRDMSTSGAVIDGVVHPTWDEIGEPGQLEYIADAEFTISVLERLGFVRSLSGQIADLIQLQAECEQLRADYETVRAQRSTALKSVEELTRRADRAELLNQVTQQQFRESARTNSERTRAAQDPYVVAEVLAGIKAELEKSPIVTLAGAGGTYEWIDQRIDELRSGSLGSTSNTGDNDE